MQKSIRRILIKMLHPLNAKLGYQSPEALSLLDNFFETLVKIHFIPDHVIDVGANHGKWTKTALCYFPDAYFTLLEPQRWLEKHVQDLLNKNPKVRFYPYGAGSQAGSFKFTIADQDDSSHFRLNEEDAKKQGLKQIDVRVVTLNELVISENLPNPDIIKIDAEGLDLEVLKGSDHFFGKTEIFLVEVAVTATDIENQFYQVVQYMDANGYKLFDITDLNRPFEPKILWLAELVFIRKNGIIDSRRIIHFG